MGTHWSTLDLPKKSQFPYFREVICQAYMPVTSYSEDTSAFNLKVSKRRLGRCSIMELTADAHRVTRDRRAIGGSDGEYYAIKLVRKGRGIVEQKGNTTPISAGDMCLYDCSSPHVCEFRESFAITTYQIPRDFLAPRLLDPARVGATLIAASSGFGALVRSYLLELVQLPEQQNDADAAKLNEILCNLLSLALGQANRAEHFDDRSINQIRLLAIKDYVRHNLADPSLSPASVAEVCGISVRYLHKLFEPQGQSFGRWLLRQRLERCCEQIADPGFSNKSLSAIAFAWGFNNISHFDRVFRDEYGACPREYRKRALDRLDSANNH